VRRLLAAWRAAHVPRFIGDQVNTRLRDSVVGQMAFWDTANLRLVQAHGATVETRIESPADRTAVEVSVRVHGELSDDLMCEVANLETLLPTEYGWVRLDPSPAPDDTPVRVARVVRQMEFVDLPFASFQLVQAERERRLTKPPALVHAAADPIIATALDATADGEGGLRYLPTVDTIEAEFNVRPYCLPMPGRIEDARPRLRALYDALLFVAPGIASVCLHRPDPVALSEARLLALNWKRFADYFQGHLESAGYGDLATLRNVIDRYFLPASYLAAMTVRTAGQTDAEALTLGNIMAATLGGAKAFAVHPPTRDVGLEALTLPEIDVPTSDWTDRRKATFLRQLISAMRAQGVVVPEGEDARAILEFMMLMPHVYTVREAIGVLGLPIADEEGLPGTNSRPLPPFSMPSRPPGDGPAVTGSEEDAPPIGRVRIGLTNVARVAAGGCGAAARDWHSIPLADLTKHALIVGSTGSGKTLTTSFIAREVSRSGTPIMIIEPVKTEYSDRLSGRIPNLQRLRLEGRPGNIQDGDFLAFDPLRVQDGITVARHASYLKSCFEAAFTMEPVLALMLENALLAYYRADSPHGCGLDLFDMGGRESCAVREGDVYPSFATFRRYLVDVFLPNDFTDSDSPDSPAKTLRDMFRRRFSNLGDGVLGRCFAEADRLAVEDLDTNYDLLERYLRNNTVIELDAVPDGEQKSLAMAFLLTYIFEKRQADDLAEREGRQERSGRPLRHLLIVEEAHRLLASPPAAARVDSAGQDPRAKAVGLFTDMLAEIRAFGQGLMIVEQIPTKIASEAVKNTNLKIMLRLTAKDDRDYLGEAMSFTEAQKRFVTNLRASPRDGVNFVVFDESLDQPMMAALPWPPKERADDWLYDELFEGSDADGD
jgi:Helicase HerA, central domain